MTFDFLPASHWLSFSEAGCDHKNEVTDLGSRTGCKCTFSALLLFWTIAEQGTRQEKNDLHNACAIPVVVQTAQYKSCQRCIDFSLVFGNEENTMLVARQPWLCYHRCSLLNKDVSFGFLSCFQKLNYFRSVSPFSFFINALLTQRGKKGIPVMFQSYKED